MLPNCGKLNQSKTETGLQLQVKKEGKKNKHWIPADSFQQTNLRSYLKAKTRNNSQTAFYWQFSFKQ